MILEILEKSSDVVGIIGVILLLISYFLLSTNKMSSQSFSYQLYNFFGAVFILFSLCFNWNTASALIETSWIIISLIGMYRIFSARKARKEDNV